MRQTASLLPVLRRGLRMNDIRVCLWPLQYSIFSAGLGIFQDVVGKGEELGVKLVGVLLRRGNGAGKLVI